MGAEAGLDEESRRHLALVRGSADALLRIVDDILDLARMESGRVTVEISNFDAAALIADTVETLRPAAIAKGLALSVDCAGLPRPWLRADAGRIRQVLVNLVGNAVKFTEAGEVRVAAWLPPGRTLQVKVSDSGPGLSEADRANLFQPFVRAGRAGRDRRSGTGLGLAISQRILETLGGAIELESQPGQGTTFRFQIPVEPAEALAPVVEAPPQPGTQRRGRLLVVDDIATNSLVAATHLRRAGHEVDTVASGAEAIGALQRRPYDIVFMDLLMPEMDGLEATRLLRGLPGPRPVILGLTASVVGEVREACAAAGMDDVLAKPITGPSLIAAAARWLARWC